MSSLRKFSVLAMAAAAVVGAASSLWAQSSGPAPVRVAVVEERKIAPEQQFVGTVMPSQKAVVGSAVDGRVVEFPIHEGQRVEAGATLAQLLTETISLERDAAQAELEQREAELAEITNGTRPEEIEQARARRDAAKARMDYAKIRLQRLQSLYRQGRAASDEEVDEAQAAAEAAGNAYLEAVAGYELAVAGPRAEQKAQAQARVRMQKALVERLEDQLKKHTVISRFAGYVSAEHTEEGAWVNRGDPVAEIVALDEVEIEVHVVENHIPFVKPGLASQVILTALPGRDFPGTVASVVPQADPRSRTFPVKVRVMNEFEQVEVADSPAYRSPVIKAGMLARVWLPTGSEQYGPVAPKDALVFNGALKSVWVVDPKTVQRVEVNGAPHYQGAAQSVIVRPSIEDRASVLIPEGIKPGQFVVVEGNERIRPGGPGKPPLVQWPVEGSGVRSQASGVRNQESNFAITAP